MRLLTKAMNITNDHGVLMTDDGHCLGYLFEFPGRGIYSPEGKVDVTKAEADAHNRLLDEMLVKGLDENCQVGQYGTFYLKGDKVITWMGMFVAPAIRHGNSVTFTRNGKTYRGRLQKDADCFNFRRTA